MNGGMKRSNNFSSGEQRLLIDLVEKYKDIIECKKTDTDANKKKIETWKGIEREFNSLSGETFRDARILKNKYENMKKRAKKRISDDRCRKMGTGGGPYQEIQLSDIDYSIVNLLGVRAEGLPSTFGIDSGVLVLDEESGPVTDGTNAKDMGIAVITKEPSVNMPTTSATNETEDILKLPKGNGNEDEMEKQHGDWSSYTPQQLRQPESSALQTKWRGKKDISSKIQSWALSKTRCEETRVECLREEHALRMKQMTEQHTKLLELMQEEHNRKMTRADELHALQMELMKKSL